MNINQIEMVSIDQLVPEKHAYRAMKKALNFEKIAKNVKLEKSETGATGYTIIRLIMCLILQFTEDLSDREFERFITEKSSLFMFD